MGSGIAQVAAQAGDTVLLNDRAPEFVERGLPSSSATSIVRSKRESSTEGERDAVLRHITPQLEWEPLEVDVAIEAASEHLETKLAIFRRLDELTPPATILASNTSSISITKLANATQRAPRVIGMHYFNPVPVMKLVEIIRGIATAQATYEFVHGLALSRKDAGRSPQLSGLRFQSRPLSDAQRSDLRAVRRRRIGRGDRHGHEARHEPSDGTARTRGLHRTRHAALDPARALRGVQGFQIPAVSAARRIRRRRMARAQERDAVSTITHRATQTVGSRFRLRPHADVATDVRARPQFAPSAEQLEIGALAREVAQREIAPHIAEWDREHRFPRELYTKLNAAGLMGLPVAERYEGAGADYVSCALALEEIARVDAGTAVTMSVHYMIAAAIARLGSDAQKERYLPLLAAGDGIAGFALTEPGAGSDAAAIRSSARRERRRLRLNGRKQWCTTGALPP